MGPEGFTPLTDWLHESPWIDCFYREASFIAYMLSHCKTRLNSILWSLFRDTFTWEMREKGMFCLLVSLVHFKTDLSWVQREMPSFPHQVDPESSGLPSTKAPAFYFPFLLLRLKKISHGTLCIFPLSFFYFPWENNFILRIYHSVWLELMVCSGQLSS